MRSFYWFIRYYIAKNTSDGYVLKVNEMKQIKTPLLLKLFNLEILEVRHTNPELNPHSFTGVRWLIRKASKHYDMSKQIYTWRIQGDDTKKNRPMVLWERTS